MSKVRIVTDSVASIPESLLEMLRIQSVPYYIHKGIEVLRDLDAAQREAMYRWMPMAETLPRTAAPGPGDYQQAYERLVDEGARDIVSIHMTSKGSAAYQAAQIARSAILEELPKLRIEVIDTLNVSMCQGWMAIEAARAALEGQSLADIVALVREMVPVTRMIQTADTLKYLHMGGRIGRAKHLVGSLLRIKPLIGMEDGIIVALGQARSRRKAYEAMVDMVESVVGVGGKVKIAYMHALALEEAAKIKELAESRLDCVESIIAELSLALGVHTGPGTAGICYFPIR